MDAIRRIVDAERLEGLISLPDNMKRRRLELIITPVSEPLGEKKDVLAALESLMGAVPDDGKDLEDYRRERLKRYESAD